MRLSKKLLAGLAVVIAVPPGGRADASTMSPVLRAPAPNAFQGDQSRAQFTDQQLKAAAKRILEEAKQGPQTLDSLALRLPDLKRALMAAAIELLSNDGKVEEWGVGTTVSPSRYFEADAFTAAAQKIKDSLAGGKETLAQLTRALPDLRAEVVQGVLDALIEDDRVLATPGPSSDATTYSIRRRGGS